MASIYASVKVAGRDGGSFVGFALPAGAAVSALALPVARELRLEAESLRFFEVSEADVEAIVGEGAPDGTEAAILAARSPLPPTRRISADVWLLAAGKQRAADSAAAAATVAAAATAAAEAATPSPLSVSEAVGPTFEHEARIVIGSVLREVCPWVVDHSTVLSRTLDRDGNGREGDIMCYLRGDALTPCVPLPTQGVAVVGTQAGAAAAEPLPPLALPEGEQFSPTDASRFGPHKYFVAEAYSGARGLSKLRKVAQLETLVGFMLQRWAAQHDGAPVATDVTQLVGAAALVFSAGDEPRRIALSGAVALVESALAGSGNLRRLAAAGRLLVVVLDKRQSPTTFFERAVARDLGNLGQRLACVPKLIDERLARVPGLIDERLARMPEEVAERVEARLAARATAAAAAS